MYRNTWRVEFEFSEQKSAQKICGEEENKKKKHQ